MELSKNQIEILEHTKYRAAGGFFCGSSNDMDILIKKGLMELAGTKSFVPDKYYKLTNEGKLFLKDL